MGEGWVAGGWIVYYCYRTALSSLYLWYIVGFAAIATAAAAADRCSFSLITLAVVAVFWLLLV